jgi:hypothetical protein
MDPDDAPTLDALAQRHYGAGDATRKAPTYWRTYEGLLSRRRFENLKILELGVWSGASLLIWRDYLPNAVIVGVDILPAPASVAGQDRIHVIQGSQDDPSVLGQASAIAGGPFDLIVDDASHIGYLTKRSFQDLFPRALAPGGFYVIEDFGTGYLGQYPDGEDFRPPDWQDAVPGTTVFASSQFGMVGVVKQLIDEMMQELMTGQRSWLAIDRITIETNLAIIRKSTLPAGPRPRPEPAAAGAVRDLAPAVNAIAATVAEHAARIEELERVVARARRWLAPALWLLRLARPPG